MVHTGRVYAERGDKASLQKIFATIDERAQHLGAFIGGYARFASCPVHGCRRCPGRPC